MKDETQTPARHLYEHDQPTVVHHPEEDMTILGRWLYRGLEKGPIFWLFLVGSVLAFVAVVGFGNFLTTSQTGDVKAWDELAAAKTPEERIEIAKLHAGSAAAEWGLLQAANDLYLQGFGDLPNNRDAALPRLRKALDLYQQVAKETPITKPAARIAALGVARTLEARNELAEAINQYKAVVSKFPDTLEADQAADVLKDLQRPDAADFYKQFYAYKAPQVTLPPGGDATLGLPLNHPALDGPTTLGPALGGGSALDSLLSPGVSLPSTAPPASALPEPPPATTTPDAKPADPSPTPAATPAPDSKPATPAALPADPFAPAPKL
ncbi:hypothetical protein EP7_003130 [Isosphaeraceae bacterium EP7]